jgi:hypothetical protein
MLAKTGTVTGESMASTRSLPHVESAHVSYSHTDSLSILSEQIIDVESIAELGIISNSASEVPRVEICHRMD